MNLCEVVFPFYYCPNLKWPIDSAVRMAEDNKLQLVLRKVTVQNAANLEESLRYISPCIFYYLRFVVFACFFLQLKLLFFILYQECTDVSPIDGIPNGS